MTPTRLSIEVAAPPMPLILADQDFLSSLASVESKVAALRVTDAESAQAAATLQGRLTTAGKMLEATRVALKRPYLEIERKIDEVAEGPRVRISVAKRTLADAITVYDQEQRRIAAERELERQAEIQRR